MFLFLHNINNIILILLIKHENFVNVECYNNYKIHKI